MSGSPLKDMVSLWHVLLSYLMQKATPSVENTGTSSVNGDMLVDPALIIKDRPVSVLQNTQPQNTKQSQIIWTESVSRTEENVVMTVYVD